ncbi:MAG TPA: hypothetical protein VF594_04825 [Rubricoccaceae bacterium]|jgi:hypothetical protein
MDSTDRADDLTPRTPPTDPAMDFDWGDDFGSNAAPGSKGKKAFGVGPASDGDDLTRSDRGGVDTFERGKE